MQILLTNDDGIYAPGLRAMERQLQRLGDVCVTAPATEQSGVSHSITFLSPLVCKQVYDGDRLRGWAVEGSPADSVKLGVYECCPRRPDLVVSGMNSGHNAGINVLYSGTVAAAIEGAFFGITSVAVSLEYDEHADFDRACEIAVGIIEQILAQPDHQGRLYNLNIPLAALDDPGDVHVVPMCVRPGSVRFIKRQDPRDRDYFWAESDPVPSDSSEETDLAAFGRGRITLTPLHFDMSDRAFLSQMQSWKLSGNSTAASRVDP